MVRVGKEYLRRVALEAYGVDLSDERLETLARLVNKALDALERSCEVGLDGVEPAMKFDLSEE